MVGRRVTKGLFGHFRVLRYDSQLKVAHYVLWPSARQSFARCCRKGT